MPTVLPEIASPSEATSVLFQGLPSGDTPTHGSRGLAVQSLTPED